MLHSRHFRYRDKMHILGAMLLTLCEHQGALYDPASREMHGLLHDQTPWNRGGGCWINTWKSTYPSPQRQHQNASPLLEQKWHSYGKNVLPDSMHLKRITQNSKLVWSVQGGTNHFCTGVHQGTCLAPISGTPLLGSFLAYEPNRVVHVVLHSTEISESVNFSEMSM